MGYNPNERDQADAGGQCTTQARGDDADDNGGESKTEMENDNETGTRRVRTAERTKRSESKEFYVYTTMHTPLCLLLHPSAIPTIEHSAARLRRALGPADKGL